MKKYAVMKKIGTFSATVDREFDNIDDARMYRNLCVASESGNWQYYVVEVLEQRLFHVLCLVDYSPNYQYYGKDSSEYSQDDCRRRGN